MIFVLVLKIESITDRKICNGKNSRWILLKLDSLPNRKIATAFTQKRTPECMQSDVFIFAKQNKKRKSSQHFHQTALPPTTTALLNLYYIFKTLWSALFFAQSSMPWKKCFVCCQQAKKLKFLFRRKVNTVNTL